MLKTILLINILIQSSLAFGYFSVDDCGVFETIGTLRAKEKESEKYYLAISSGRDAKRIEIGEYDTSFYHRLKALEGSNIKLKIRLEKSLRDKGRAKILEIVSDAITVIESDGSEAPLIKEIKGEKCL